MQNRVMRSPRGEQERQPAEPQTVNAQESRGWQGNNKQYGYQLEAG